MNCYAEHSVVRFQDRFGGGLVEQGPHGPRWTGTIACVPRRLDLPLRWQRPRRIFVASQSDLFHPGVPDAFVAAVFGAMALAPQHQFILLTKRPQRMLAWFEEHHDRGHVAECIAALYVTHPQAAALFPLTSRRAIGAGQRGWPLPNLWLGVSAEDQATADERVPLLLKTPAAVRFVSAEPLLGPIWLADHLRPPVGSWKGLQWVIVGGESGPGHRPMRLWWAQTILAQCATAGVPAFMKQLGGFPEVEEEGGSFGRYDAGPDRKGGDMERWPEDLRVREWPPS